MPEKPLSLRSQPMEKPQGGDVNLGRFYSSSSNICNSCISKHFTQCSGSSMQRRETYFRKQLLNIYSSTRQPRKKNVIPNSFLNSDCIKRNLYIKQEHLTHMVIFHWLVMDKLSIMSRPCHATRNVVTAKELKVSAGSLLVVFPSPKEQNDCPILHAKEVFGLRAQSCTRTLTE